MPEELNLVTQLAIILIAAGVFTVISKALKQPLILGYIVAGIIVGPHLGIFPQFSPESVDEWSELGVIFLLFGLGLEFSFKKLLSVGSSAAILAVTNCIGMFIIGMTTGSAIGWSSMESTFLGGMMSMSSTTIIIKAYTDMGIKNKPYSTLIFGALVVEDLLAVLLMVLLSTLAVSNQFSGGEMLMALAKLVFFLVLCFLVGMYVIPLLLKRAKKYLTDEIRLLVGIGLCFLLVVFANMSGFSSALGAFIMGSVLASTLEGENIAKVTVPIKDLFGAIFFVSVGMMVDPSVIAEHWGIILIITGIAMLGILICSVCGTLLAGKDLDTAIHSGFTLAQLGEFSFIIASLGVSLGVVRGFIYPVIISVSVITTFTTPYMIKAADPVSAWLHKKLPSSVLSKLNRSEKAAAQSTAEKNEWKAYLKSYALRVGLYSVILIAIMASAQEWLANLITHFFTGWSDNLVTLVKVVLTMLFMAPFVYGLGVNSGALYEYSRKIYKRNHMAKWPLFALILFRTLLAVTFAIAPILANYPLTGWKALLIFIAIAVFIVMGRKATNKFTLVEDRFFKNLNEKEEYEKSLAPVTNSVNEVFAGYDVHAEDFAISPYFSHIGLRLREMPFRHTAGINVVKIKRGEKSIIIPSGDEKIYPGDILVVVGTSEQLDTFRKVLDENVESPVVMEDDFVVEPLVVSHDSDLAGKTLRELDMRKNGCVVISLSRGGHLTANPKADFMIEDGDTVWIAGLKSSIDWYKNIE